MLMAELPIQVPPTLARVFGFNEAAVIQTIRFWLDPNSHPYSALHFQDGCYWIPDLFEHLYQKFPFWDEDEIAYMGAKFEQSGILMVLQDTSQGLGESREKITYHTLNPDLLNENSAATVKLVPAVPFINDILPSANENARAQSSFAAEVHRRGENVYALEVQDTGHFLACELFLEIQKAGEALRAGELPSREVFCHFPKIDDERLKEFVWNDPTLQKILMGVFQMSILKQLFLFCEAHTASKLVIFTDDAEANELKIYRDFLATQQGQNPTATREKWGGQWGYKWGESPGIGMLIPVSPEVFSAWLSFAETTIIRFRQVLWREQKTNPSIHYYLKSRRLPEV